MPASKDTLIRIAREHPDLQEVINPMLKVAFEVDMKDIERKSEGLEVVLFDLISSIVNAEHEARRSGSRNDLKTADILKDLSSEVKAMAEAFRKYDRNLGRMRDWVDEMDEQNDEWE